MQPNRPSSNKLRKARVSIQNQIYLVTFVTEKRRVRFTDFYCARLMISALNKSNNTETLAFTVMPDHVHWLLQLRDQTSLSRVLQSLKSVSAHRLNRHLGRKGRFWQDGFHDHALRKEEDVIDAARYIVGNPLRAGLVNSVGDYPHWDAVWL